MANRRHSKRFGPNPFAKGQCVGCGKEEPTEMCSLEAADGMSGGWFPLCARCHAQYIALNDDRARDYFLECLSETLRRRLLA